MRLKTGNEEPITDPISCAGRNAVHFLGRSAFDVPQIHAKRPPHRTNLD
jgi:hypothetical protein